MTTTSNSFKGWEKVAKEMQFRKPDAHNFMKQIREANLGDMDKAELCCALVSENPVELPDNMKSYLLALIHLEWRNFGPLLDKLIEEIKKESIT